MLNQGELAYYLRPDELVQHSQELDSMGLGVSTSARIARQLRERGVNLKPDIYKQEQLISDVLKLYKGERA